MAKTIWKFELRLGTTSFVMGEFLGDHYYYKVDNHCTEMHICTYCLDKLKKAINEDRI